MELYPDIAKEWNYEKNGDLTPYDVGKGCIKQIWWKCQYGHEWSTTVNHRVTGTNCPKCSASGSSVAEQGIAYYLKKTFRVEQREKIGNNEIDIYLPDYKIGIEYDGVYYHESEYARKREEEKNKKMIFEGIRLLRIKETREPDITVKKEGDVFYYNSARYLGKNYEQVIIQLLRCIESIVGEAVYSDVNVKRDIIAIREKGAKVFLDNSIEILHPSVAQEWNYERNGELLPSMFSSGSTQKVWWRCASGHEWQAPISRRARGSECPYCSGRIANPGENDLQTKYPSLSREWSTEKNVKLDIKTIPVGSHKKAFSNGKRPYTVELNLVQGALNVEE